MGTLDKCPHVPQWKSSLDAHSEFHACNRLENLTPFSLKTFFLRGLKAAQAWAVRTLLSSSYLLWPALKEPKCLYLSTTWTLNVAKSGEETSTIGSAWLCRDWVADAEPTPWYVMMISVFPAESFTCMPCVVRPAATDLKASLTLSNSWPGESAKTVIVKSSKKAGMGSLHESSAGCWWNVCFWPKGILGLKSWSSSLLATFSILVGKQKQRQRPRKGALDVCLAWPHLLCWSL